MTTSPGRSLHWYLIVGLLFAIPPVLAAFGIHLPQQPADRWMTEALTVEGLEVGAADGPPVTMMLEDMAPVLPCVVVLQSDRLLARETLMALRQVVIEIETARPGCDVSWCGDAPSRSGLLRRPRSIIPADDAADRHWERVGQQLQEHPLVDQHVLSSDASTMLLLLSESTVETEQVARKILSRELEPLQVEYWLTGEALMFREDRAALDFWAGPVLGISAFVVAIVGLCMLRAIRRSLAVAAGPVMALGLAIGWEAFLGMPFNVLAAADVPVFVLVLAFADSLHILLAVEEEFGQTQDHREAAHRAMKRMLRPCFLTSLTTSLAFASLMLSDQPMVYGFGRNAAIAVAVAFVGVVTAMPLAAADCVRRRRPQLVAASSRPHRWIHRPILLGVKYPAAIVAATLVITGGLLAYSTTTLYPDDRIDLRLSTAEPSYQGLMKCDDQLGGLRQIRVQLEWPADMSDEAVWDILSGVQQQIADSESFSEPLSILNALQLLPGESSARSLRYAGKLAQDRMANFWDGDHRQAAVEFRVPDRGVQYIEEDLTRLRSLLQHEESLWPGLQTTVNGQCLLQSTLVQTTISEMSWSVALAACTILLVIWLAYGRLTYALVSILPNTFALTLTVAFRASLTPSLDISSACAASICLGIAVDDTIHFLEALRHARGPSGSRIRILNAGHLVGRALVTTTVTLLFGFAAVFVAPLPTHQFFAGMVIAMLPAALLGDLVILPAVLTLLRKGVSPAVKHPVAHESPIVQRSGTTA